MSGRRPASKKRATRSVAYRGRVVHARHRPREHRLSYRVFYLLVDLDELPDLDRRFRLFGYNRAAPFSFHDKDHGPGDGSDLRAWVDTQLAEAGMPLPGGHVELLCFPRIFGYVFNPISIYFCYDRDGELRAALYEVSNTFRETHTYVLPVAPGSGTMVHHAFDKVLYVSPFIPMACRYRVALRRPDDHASIAIRESDAEGELLAATFHGERQELSTRFLAASLLRFPFLTVKVMAGIHLDALKLWLKRTPVFRHPEPPAHAVSIIETPAAHQDVRVRTD